MLLLSDGTVMGQNGQGATWYRLTPDNHGSYVNGTWTTLASMHNDRLYYGSDVLTNGNVYVAGGEYGAGANKAEMYDPVRNVWTPLPTPSGYQIHDDISETLPGGNVLQWAASGTLIYNAASNSWSVAGATSGGAGMGEAGWVKLPDDSILTINGGSTTTERYFPSLNQWIAQGSVPVPMYDSQSELGPGFLLPDGRVIFFGGTTNTAIFTPSALGGTNPGTWAAGATMPGNLGMPDAPGCMMVNGKILCVLGTNGTYNAPSSFYEYDYLANSFTQINGPTGLTYGSAPYVTRMLALPDGNVLFSDFGTQLYVYQPDPSPLAAGKPTILSITTNSDGSFHMTGTLLNGISEGAAYGDDAQMASDYPLVRMTNSLGVVSYARTFNWSSTSVLTNKIVATEFSLPAGLASGTYSLVVSANGNSSDPFSFTTPFSMGVSPNAGFNFTGPVGGPFSPVFQNFSLTNSGTSPLNWTLLNTSAWLNVSVTNGTLTPGAGATPVTVSLNSTASNMLAGVYSTTMWFSNLTGGEAFSRQFTLTVLSGDSPVAFSGFNRDVAVERTASGGTPASFAQPFDVGNDYGFYEAGLVATNAALGLPQGGAFTSSLDNATTFQLGPYNGNNVLFMSSGATTGTLILSTPRAYSSLSILASSANGGGNGSVVIHFVDGSASSPINFAALDWFNNLGAGITHIGRIRLTAYSTDDPGANNPNLYHTKVDLTARGLAGKAISFLTFTMPGGAGTSSATDTGVFALSGTPSRPPVIASQPQNLTVLAGNPAMFSLTATGAVQLSYVWKFNGTNLSENGHITGSQGNLLTITGTTTNDAGDYFAVVTNIFGSATSVLATLTVALPPAFQTVMQSNGVLAFTWNAGTGLVYQVQYSTNLAQTNWVNLGSTNTATNSTATFYDPIGPDPQRFYRVILLP